MCSSDLYAAAEQNADNGIVVTAPTCGSCGVLPSVLMYMQDKYQLSDDKIARALGVAGIIGNLIKRNASISGAECGCQAEIGSACSMAAAAMCDIMDMNFWGFTAGLLDVLWDRFPDFLDENLPKNPLKCEYFLPFVVNSQLADGSARVRMLHCDETWYGVTYKDDLQSVCDAIADMKHRGVYEEELWK